MFFTLFLQFIFYLYWGNTDLDSDERVASQLEDYSLVGFSKDEEFSLDLSYDDWNSFEVGQSVTLKIFFGDTAEIVE